MGGVLTTSPSLFTASCHSSEGWNPFMPYPLAPSPNRTLAKIINYLFGEGDFLLRGASAPLRQATSFVKKLDVMKLRDYNARYNELVIINNKH